MFMAEPTSHGTESRNQSVDPNESCSSFDVKGHWPLASGILFQGGAAMLAIWLCTLAG